MSRPSPGRSHQFNKCPGWSNPIAPLLHEDFSCRRARIAQAGQAGTSPNPEPAKIGAASFASGSSQRQICSAALTAALASVSSMMRPEAGLTRMSGRPSRRAPNQSAGQLVLLQRAACCPGCLAELSLVSIRSGDSTSAAGNSARQALPTGHICLPEAAHVETERLRQRIYQSTTSMVKGRAMLTHKIDGIAYYPT